MFNYKNYQRSINYSKFISLRLVVKEVLKFHINHCRRPHSTAILEGLRKKGSEEFRDQKSNPQSSALKAELVKVKDVQRAEKWRLDTRFDAGIPYCLHALMFMTLVKSICNLWPLDVIAIILYSYASPARCQERNPSGCKVRPIPQNYKKKNVICDRYHNKSAFVSVMFQCFKRIPF